MFHRALVITPKSEKDLSKLQKQFNANVEKISELKQRLQKDEISLRLIVTCIQSDIIPVEQKHFDKIVELIYVFDKHHNDPFFKQKEKSKMADFIINKSKELIEGTGNEVLKTIYDKYADEPFDKMDAEVKNPTDVSDPQKMQEYMQEEQAEAQAKKQKTKKQIEKEEKIKAEAKNVSKAARSIYTDLVKAFHPDRERDETERDRKTEIMKRVTQAYEKDDLFELLKLKIALQSSGIESFTMVDEQLKYYNKILKEQIRALQESLWQLRSQGLGATGGKDLLSRFGEDEKTIKAQITRQVNQLKNNIKMAQQNILTLGVKENMRRFLRDYQIQENF